MTIGISKQRLEALRARYAEEFRIPEACVIDDLIHDECTELEPSTYAEAYNKGFSDGVNVTTEPNPWRRVDGNTPRDRTIRLLYPKSGDDYDRLVLESKYTEYFELHSNRKPRYWQEVTPDPV